MPPLTAKEVAYPFSSSEVPPHSFSAKRLRRAAPGQTVPKQKRRSTKASDMPPLTMKELAYSSSSSEVPPYSFGAKRLRRVAPGQTVPKQKQRSTKASHMPPLTRAAPGGENVAYHVDDDEATFLEEMDDETEVKIDDESEDDAKVLEEVENTLKKHEKSWEVFFQYTGATSLECSEQSSYDEHPKTMGICPRTD